MIALLQRVSQASVSVAGEVIGQIDQGLMVLLAVQPEDDLAKTQRLAQRVANYRLFSDTSGKMNLNVGQVNGDILVVSQFTLAADTTRGLRPSFTSAAAPAMSEALYAAFVDELRTMGFAAPTGRFGADMQVALINDGPVTINLSI